MLAPPQLRRVHPPNREGALCFRSAASGTAYRMMATEVPRIKLLCQRLCARVKRLRWRAYALRGGRFGKGMTYMAWGFLVMAVGHLHMQIEHYYGINIFKSVLGQISGSIAWFIALVVTWGLSGLGFWSIYKASRGA